jgi:hypothetical protein
MDDPARPAKAIVTRRATNAQPWATMQQSNWRGSARDGAGAIDAGRSGQGGFVRRPLAGQSVEHGPELTSSGFVRKSRSRSNEIGSLNETMIHLKSAANWSKM